MSGTVLVATDGSETAETAVREAIAVAAERDARLHVLGVVDRRRLGEPSLSSEELVTIELEDACQTALADARARAQAADVEVVCETCHGVPEEAIVAAADAVDADLVVLEEGSGRLARRVRDSHATEVRQATSA